MYQQLKVKAWNCLPKHEKTLPTHKCVATPWLRTTVIYYYLFQLLVLAVIFSFNFASGFHLRLARSPQDGGVEDLK